MHTHGTGDLHPADARVLFDRLAAVLRVIHAQGHRQQPFSMRALRVVVEDLVQGQADLLGLDHLGRDETDPDFDPRGVPRAGAGNPLDGHAIQRTAELVPPTQMG